MQRWACVVVAIASGGCFTVGVQGGGNIPLDGAASRYYSARFQMAGFINGVPDPLPVIIQPLFSMGVGPLGKKSEGPFMLGGRLTSRSHGWKPGFYAQFEAGSPADLMHEGKSWAISIGSAWTTVVIKDDDYWMPDALGSITIGLTYWHQEQFGIGGGEFLGIEATLIGGTNIIDFFAAVFEAGDND
jgi:hypothetical protein